MKPTTKKEKNDVKEMIKDISKDILDWIRKGEVMDNTEQLNPSTGTVYKGLNKFWLNMVARIKGMANNQWMTLNQVNELGGSVNKGSKSTAVFFASPVFYYKGSDGKKFTVKANGRTDADEQAFEKDPGSEYDGQYTVFKYYRVFNVIQTSMFNKYPIKTNISPLINPLEARKLIYESLDEKKDFYDRKLIALFGASCLTQIMPTDEEISFVEGWLKKLDENPQYLFWISNDAYKAADKILDSLKKVA